MTRHAKASPAGSTQRQGSRLGRFFRGAFAPRAFLPGAKGSGAPSLGTADRNGARAGLATLAAFMVLFALPAAAQASPPTLVPDGQIQSHGALGVAVDSSTGASQGDVYVGAFLYKESEEGEFFFGRVNKYDPTGNLLAPPSPFGVANGFGDKGTAYSGAAVNPVNGDLYILDALYSEIDVFNPATGALKESFPVTPSNNFPFFLPWTVVGIATDSAGNVYVPVVPENKIVEYSEAGAFVKALGREVDKTQVELREEQEAHSEPVTVTKEQEDVCTAASGDTCGAGAAGAGSGALSGPTAVALDPAGDLWVADSGNARIEQLSPADAPLAEIPVEGTLESLAADPHGHVFATLRNSADFCGSLTPPCSHLLEYSSAGTQLGDFGAGEYGAQEETSGPLPTMVAVDQSTGRVYVTSGIVVEYLGEHSRVYIYAPPTPPKIESELAVGATTSEAKLGALVNPGGIATSYRFEYGTTTAYGQTAPTPAGDAGTGFKPRTVWASPSGLQPGTTYHYRVVVANELGEVKGEDRTFTTATAAQSACPNDRFRTGFSAALPDCRAYELLTPPNQASTQPDKDLLGAEETLKNTVAAPGGNSLAFRMEDVLPGSPSAAEAYLATRGPAGWSLENLYPPTNYNGFTCPAGFEAAAAYSTDQTKAILTLPGGGDCGTEPEVVSGEPRSDQSSGIGNILLRDNATATYQLVNLTPPGVTPANAEFIAASPDLNRVVFKEQAPLTPEAPPGVDNLYEWSAGHLRLLSPPGVTPVAASYQAISADGSRVFFTAQGNLYARVDGAETLQLDASQASGSGGGAEFLRAGQDGSQVYFTDDASAALTADTQPGSGTNLYLYDSTAPAGHHLTDLTPVSNAGTPELSGLSKDGSQVYFTDDASAALTADTQPGSGTNLYRYAAGQLTDLTPAPHAEVLGARVSQDGSSVYFTAKGSLAPGATQGQSNPYLWHAGATTFLSNLAGASLRNLKVSPDLRFFAFQTNQSLTGYDNTDVGCLENACQEIYLYDTSTDTLSCASCNPSGESPTFGGAGFEGGGGFGRNPRNLSDNGRLFFDSGEALLPSDTNGAGGCSTNRAGEPTCTDVYEFEPAGVGTCADPAGCLFLISTGTGTRITYFVDASANGNDVFIREFQSLVPAAKGEDQSTLYDVRVDGGFPEPTSPPPCTTADSCRPAPQPQPSISGSPATATLAGPGNVHPTGRRHHRHHKKKHKRSHKRANTNRGGHK